FDTQTLSLFSQRLRNCPTFKFSYKKDCRDAAVLMPLCIVDNKPSVLFTVRNLNLRTHRGEISFPGGKADASDPSLEHTALRETFEEVGIAPDSIDILGRYSSVPNKTGSLCVHPFVGFIRDPIDPDALKFNPDEVSTVFTLSLDYLL
ncbi:NUDIX hydrolase domain-like protein, partial [Radiomyces spectabilis]|uniref:NUDIX hydrolase domain-like protein n=1 Tax=Radiomyces spectabilis TaxID=64574 RepID=UPI00221FFA35